MRFDLAQRIRATVDSVAAGPLLVRAGIFLTALGALLTAYPTALITSRLVLGLVLLAAAAMIAPRSWTVTAVVLLAVGGWLYSTMGYEEPVTLPRVFGIAGLLYLTHSLAALGAALPLDAVVGPEVLTRWAGRAMLVVVGSAVPALAVVVIADAVRGAFLLASLLGLAAMVGLTCLLTYLLRRS
jgi:hypothetical protein